MSILSNLAALANEPFLGQLSKLLKFEISAESYEAATKTAMSALKNISTSKDGIKDIRAAISSDGNDGEILTQIKELFSGDAGIALLKSAAGVRGFLFGANESQIVENFSKNHQIENIVSENLLGIGGLLMLNQLGKEAAGLNDDELAKIIKSEKTDTLATVYQKAYHKKEDIKSGHFNIYPWIFLGLLTLAFVFYLQQCVHPETEQATLSSGSTRTFGSGQKLDVGANSLENDMLSFIENPRSLVDKDLWFNFRELKFKTGSAEIDSTSMKEVRNLALILNEYPNVNIKIGGYTDNVGNEASNLQLSTNRASNVLKALIDLGVDALRLEFEGYGSAHAIADNAKEVGRAQNRRIAVRINAK